MLKEFLDTGNAYAATKVPTISGPANLAEYINEIVSRLLPIVGAVALAFVIYGGVQFIMSGGDAEKVTKARKTLTWSIAGVILIVLSYFIVVSLNSIINNKL